MCGVRFRFSFFLLARRLPTDVNHSRPQRADDKRRCHNQRYSMKIEYLPNNISAIFTRPIRWDQTRLDGAHPDRRCNSLTQACSARECSNLTAMAKPMNHVHRSSTRPQSDCCCTSQIASSSCKENERQSLARRLRSCQPDRFMRGGRFAVLSHGSSTVYGRGVNGRLKT